MKNHDEKIIKGKLSLFLTKIIEKDATVKTELESQKKAVPPGLNFQDQELAFNSHLRKATISEIIQCKRLAKLTTIIKFLKAIKMTFPEFAEEFEKITIEEAQEQYQKKRGKVD
ncbi:hypothetical protein SAMN04489724_3008 [Algoriphagus locisalis]|uniref:HTH cro/C1-type domain-containing protein n=1 Tax=Algoriphagus locisalis TaxID=305507 RepID=A0A1I7CAG7_9BACT|nr:hypothetical protein [Algoriphagus locisalis]SFT96387.1 hypothetical protein SAMN04489724_3008 [Algoriphagus locisalis]